MRKGGGGGRGPSISFIFRVIYLTPPPPRWNEVDLKVCKPFNLRNTCVLLVQCIMPGVFSHQNRANIDKIYMNNLLNTTLGLISI